MLTSRPAAQALDDLDAVLIRQRQVDDDGVRPAPRRSGEALLAILGNVSSVTMGCEDDGQHAQHLRFVFDDENQLLRWRLTRRGHTTSLASLT